MARAGPEWIGRACAWNQVSGAAGRAGRRASGRERLEVVVPRCKGARAGTACASACGTLTRLRSLRPEGARVQLEGAHHIPALTPTPPTSPMPGLCNRAIPNCISCESSGQPLCRPRERRSCTLGSRMPTLVLDDRSAFETQACGASSQGSRAAQPALRRARQPSHRASRRGTTHARLLTGRFTPYRGSFSPRATCQQCLAGYSIAPGGRGCW